MTIDNERTRTDDTASTDKVFEADVIEGDNISASSDVRHPKRTGGEVRVSAVATNSVTIYYDAADVERRKTIYRLNRGNRSSEE